MYTISYFCDLENQKDFVIKVEPPKEMAGFFDGAERILNLYYQIKYKQDHEIECPEYKLADGTSVAIIPWYLIIGRPYPIQVYLFACDKYSRNPDIGQRGAANATRTEFNLDTFSHTTLGRAFKTIEESRKKALEARFGSEMKACTEENTPPAPVVKDIVDDEETQGKRRFPSVEDTAERRTEMVNFLHKFSEAYAKGNIEVASCKFVKYWYGKTEKLLL